MKLPVNASAKGFLRGESICNNAIGHVNRKYVLNVDIEDFFPSVRGRDVYSVFFKRLGYKSSVATILTNLTTYKDMLPQGAPTSPCLSNLVCDSLDRRIEAFCQKNGLNYSRYADDITISGDVRLGFVLPILQHILSDYGFKINAKKIRFAHAGKQMLVTGLTVNEKVAVPRNQRRVYRAMFHQAKISPQKFKSQFNKLQGYYSFLKMVSPADGCLQEYKSTLDFVAAA